MALLISNAVPAGTDAPSTIDDVIRAFKIAVQDIFGLPDNTTISAAVMSVDSGGLQYLAFTDEAADAAAAGRLQRNAANLTFHDGTAARTLVNTATAQTLTTKTLTSPIVGTQITLDQTTADYTLTWADPAAARAISIPDPLGTDVFVFRDMTQTLTNKTLTAPSLGGSDMTAVDEIALNDAAADATAAGRIRRNAANLTFHDGTAARTLVNTATAQTLTTKTLTSPIVGTQITLDQTTADYTLTWADPAAARAISIPDPLGTDVFVFRDMTQTLINKTLTAPVLSGSVTGTYTLAGTPTLSGTVAGTPTWASTQTFPAVTLSGNGAITPAAVSGTPAQHALFQENVVKGRVKITWAAGTPSAAGSFNVSGIVDGGGTGLGSVTWDRDFADTNYTVTGSSGTTGVLVAVDATAVGSSNFAVFDHAGNATEVNTYIIAIGDQ